MKNFKRLIATLLIASMTFAGFPLTAQAAIVSTDEVIGIDALMSPRERVSTYLARDDVSKALQVQGLSPQVATDRVKAMSDGEVAQLAGRIDQAPAGGEVIEVLFAVFIILLVTDIMGLTKVFPFTRSAR
jgi:hypothetical protein